MKEYPILFKGDLVRAILDGRKTQTRRIPDCRNAKWQVGDRLWVRETFFEYGNYEYVDGADFEDYPWIGSNHILYAATTSVLPEISQTLKNCNHMWRKRPSLFMPRKHSRILLEITDIREEYLQDITVEDIIKEGLSTQLREHDACCDLKSQWMKLWDTCAPDGFKWVDNPKIKRVEFKRVK